MRRPGARRVVEVDSPRRIPYKPDANPVPR